MSKRQEHLDAMKALGNTENLTEGKTLEPTLSDDEKVVFNQVQKIDQCYDAFFNSKAGQLILKDLRTRCQFDDSAFHSDARVTDFNLGKQDLFRYILKKTYKSKD